MCTVVERRGRWLSNKKKTWCKGESVSTAAVISLLLYYSMVYCIF